MKSLIKKWIILFTLMSLLTTNVLANNIMLNNKSNNVDLYASEYIGSYYSSFSPIGKGSLNISLTVTCGVKVDKLSISVVLKEKIGSKWYPIANWSESKDNAYVLSLDEIYVAAHSGSEYEIDITYEAQKGANTETRHVTRNAVA